jgi:hypothetical protein
MRLYSRTGATAVDATEGHYEPAEDGGFDFPDALGAQLHGSAVGGQAQWETFIERQHRVAGEEAARRADPATLLAAVEKLVAAGEAAPAPAPAGRHSRADGAAPAKPGPGKTAGK